MPTSIISADIELPAAVIELAAKLGVTAQLPLVLEMTRSVFPESRLEVEVYQDHEIEGDVFLAVVVRHDIDDPHELVRASSNWHRRLFDCCSAPLAGAFLLDTDWRP